MHDNDLYQAAMEGRAPIAVNIEEQPDGQFKATHDNWGIQVEVIDPSITYANAEVTRQVLEKIRNGDFNVLFG